MPNYSSVLVDLGLPPNDAELFVNDFMPGLQARQFAHILPRVGVIVPWSSSFEAWFYTQLTLEGLKFLRDIWDRLNFARSNFPVLCDYIKGHSLGRVFVGPNSFV